MAVDKNAVREGTRWDLLGRLVVVEEVTSRSVIFREDDSFAPEAMKLKDFLERARDPLRAEHGRLITGLRRARRPHEMDPTSKLLCLLRDAAIYQLERTYPACAPYAEPVLPEPTVEPAPHFASAPEPHWPDEPDEPSVAVEDGMTVSDCAVAMPALDPLPEDEPRGLKRRRP